MKSILSASLLIVLMPSAHAASLPGDSAEGKRLLDANCMKCHQTDIFTRKDRQVQSLDALKEQLVACSHAIRAAAVLPRAMPMTLVSPPGPAWMSRSSLIASVGNI